MGLLSLAILASMAASSYVPVTDEEMGAFSSTVSDVRRWESQLESLFKALTVKRGYGELLKLKEKGARITMSDIPEYLDKQEAMEFIERINPSSGFYRALTFLETKVDEIDENLVKVHRLKSRQILELLPRLEREAHALENDLPRLERLCKEQQRTVQKLILKQSRIEAFLSSAIISGVYPNPPSPFLEFVDQYLIAESEDFVPGPKFQMIPLVVARLVREKCLKLVKESQKLDKQYRSELEFVKQRSRVVEKNIVQIKRSFM
jgi:hypothetical protein